MSLRQKAHVCVHVPLYILLESGAEVNKARDDGWTPLASPAKKVFWR